MRHLKYVIAICLFSTFSCTEEDLEDKKDEETPTPSCQTCSTIITDNDTGEEITSNGQSGEFCGEELEDKKNATPISFDGMTSKWVCQ